MLMDIGFTIFIVVKERRKCPMIVHNSNCEAFLNMMMQHEIYKVCLKGYRPSAGGYSRPDETALRLLCKFADVEEDIVITNDHIRSNSKLINISNKSITLVRDWMIYFGSTVSEIKSDMDNMSNRYWFTLKPFTNVIRLENCQCV